MNRKFFISLLLALIFPWRKKPDWYSSADIEMRWRAWKMRELSKVALGEYRKQMWKNLELGRKMFRMTVKD